MNVDALSREITAWQTSFVRERGREPTRADVEGDPAVREVFRRYKSLRDAAKTTAVTTTAVTPERPRARAKTYAQMRAAIRAGESESEDASECVEATPVKSASRATTTTPRRSPRLLAKTTATATATATQALRAMDCNATRAPAAAAPRAKCARPLTFSTAEAEARYKPRAAASTKTGGFAALKRDRERAIEEGGGEKALMCEATVRAMRDEALAARRKEGSKADAASMETMLATRDEGKRRKKATAKTASSIARPATASAVAVTDSRNGDASAEASKPKTAADFRAEFEAAQAEAKEASKRGNFVKTNLKRTYKSKIKNGARKKAASHYRYGGGRRSKYKAEDYAEKDPNAAPEEAPSLWASGDWCEPPPGAQAAKNDAEDALTPAKRALRAKEAADGIAREYVTAAAAESARAEAERRAKLEVGPEMQAAISRATSDPTEENLTEVLNRGFGHDKFRPGQLEIVQRVLSGKNTLAMLPTGAGKSLTYQLPAMLLPGVTLVISPLLALMADQMDSLPPSLPGGALRSDMSRDDMWDTLMRLRAGQLKILFVSPERLLNENFVNDLQNVEGGVSLACIDEAHCVSEWSHNFRPAYHRLGRILKDRVRAKTTLALTATATKKTEVSLIRQLGIPSEGVMRNVRVRDNLILSVMRVPEKAREKTLLHLLKFDELLQTGSIIVYTATQRDSERVASYLYNEGIKAKAYHAGQEPAQRRQTQAEFMMNKVRVVVATIAFGMGLDKADVRAVINYALPRSPEAYIQQAGRAGRDGAPAACITFLDVRDYLRSRSLTFCDGVDKPSITKLLQHVFQSGPVTKKARDESEWTPCVGALTASEMEIKLDMRIEAIETVLSCLDLWGEGLIDIRSKDAASVDELDAAHARGLIKILPDIRSTCEAEFFDRSPAEIGKECPLAAAIAKLVPKPRASTYKFKIVDACTHMQTGFDDVASQLKALSKNDGVRYTLADRAVGFEIIRAPPKDVLPLAKALADHCSEIEACSVGKLDALYRAMDEAADAENEEAQGEHLRRCLGAYLDTDSDELPSPPECVKRESNLLAPDIKTLLAHRSGGKTGGAGIMSARAVARILHALHSPAYPSKEWARHHTWGRHAEVDFKCILARAEEAIARARGIASDANKI